MDELGINWKILIGQFINFAILLYILKRFAYKPFLGILEKRKAGIEEGIRKSKEAEKSLQNIRGLSEKIKQSSEKEAESILQNAELRAQERAKEIADLAQKEKERALKEAKIAIEREGAEEKRMREKEAMEKTLLLAEKFLNEKITEEKDKKLIEELSAKI